MAPQPILFEKRDGVARITINRPDEANPIDGPMLRTLFDIAIDCDEDPSVRAILLTGKGDFFCSGGDLKFFRENSDRVSQLLKEGTTYLHTAQALFARMDAPMVIAVNGIAAGGGASLAFSGDIVLAAQSASFTMAYTAAGLSPDGGSTHYLPRLIGLRRAQELFLTNRRFSAQEACDWGLVTRVVSDDKLMEEAEALVERFAKGPSQAFGAVKRLLAGTFDTPMETQLDQETRYIAANMSSPDGLEGIAAFVEKRTPKFTGNR
jgi:2-(1,2-epoxy-1,2-dihydrophenyl)acetyl-CoA isomerase